MAIGTGAALLGSAVLGLGGSLLGGKAQSKAAKDAAGMTAADNAANRAFQEQIYNRNVGYIDPWMRTGQQANSAYMALLGYPQAATPAPSAFPQMQGMPANGYNGGSAFGGQGQFGAPTPPQDYAWGGGQFNGMPVPGPQFQGGQGGQFGGQVPNPITVPAINPQQAFNTYRDSTGYKFRVNQGIKAIESAFSRNRESGAATKAALRFGQGIASDEFGNYMNLLGGQSRLGLTGASALAGVGQNYGNNVVAGNQAAASAAANARLYAGQSSANMWGGLGSSFGQALGAFGAPKMGGGAAVPGNIVSGGWWGRNGF